MARKMKLQEKDKCVYKFIVAYKKGHDGNAPSFREIKEGCQLPSTNTVFSSLNRLKFFGYILYDKGISRCIQIPGGQWIPSTYYSMGKLMMENSIKLDTNV